MLTAATFGMSAGGIMDAFATAFRLPDIARRFFSDGSLSASFVPVFAQVWAADRQKAWTILSVTLFWCFLYLTAGVLIGELLCWIGIRYFDTDSRVFITAHLLSLLLPYLILISMAAVCSAALQTLGHFTVSTLVPPILNIIWLFGLSVIVPRCSDDPEGQCYVLTICILAAGVVQFLLHLPVMRSCGFRFRLHFSFVSGEVKKIFSGFVPQFFGLMSVQLNLLTATAIAWAFSGGVHQPVYWLGNMISYPLRPGAASAIYYSERMYEFQHGIIGIAIASAIYPLLSHHAAEKNYAALNDDLTLGLRIQTMLSIPAGFALMLLSDSLTHLLFQRGAFSVMDTARTADMVFWFGAGIWAFCALPILIRAFYILGDIRTPCRTGFGSLVLNAALGLVLIYQFQECGLIMAVSISAAIHCLTLLTVFTLKHGHLDFTGLTLCICRTCFACSAMCITIRSVMAVIPGHGSLDDLLRIFSCGIAGTFVFFVVYRGLGGRELGILFRGGIKKWRKKS